MVPDNWKLPDPEKGKTLYMIGIKGTGMAALAELLLGAGYAVTGSDVEETFYTDAILESLGILFNKGFQKENIPDNVQLVIRSAAYPPEHCEVAEALSRGLPVITYTEALGSYSRKSYAAAVSGVHGKTTTTALTGALLKPTDLPFSALVGSAVSVFDNRCTWNNGNDYFVAETCEYRRHFMNFSPDVILCTSIEADHLDYFKDEADIKSAFLNFFLTLPTAGTLIYCADEEGAVEMSLAAKTERPDIHLIPYGFQAKGDFQITERILSDGRQHFRLKKWDSSWELYLPGSHVALNAAGAIALSHHMLLKSGLPEEAALSAMRRGLGEFKGTRRRSEIIGHAKGILIMDDYGHHPTAIRKTLQALREFYPKRRLIVDFMSHTYSRTASLLDDFAAAFSDADQVILHKIYASAREEPIDGMNGMTLFRAMQNNHPTVSYFHEVKDALPYLRQELTEGDLFLTIGAGDNWILGQEILDFLKS